MQPRKPISSPANSVFLSSERPPLGPRGCIAGVPAKLGRHSGGWGWDLNPVGAAAPPSVTPIPSHLPRLSPSSFSDDFSSFPQWKELTFQNRNFHSEHTQLSSLGLPREKCFSAAALVTKLPVCLCWGGAGRQELGPDTCVCTRTGTHAPGGF